MCKCARCGRMFSGLAPFDRHQDVDYRRRPPVLCLDPAGLGMVLNRHGRWGCPMDDARRAQLEAMRQAARAGEDCQAARMM